MESQKTRPRQVRMKNKQGPVVIFVDGAEEDGVGADSVVGVGATLIDTATGEKRAFGGIVPTAIVRAWCKDGGKGKVIHQAELLPAAMALSIWGPKLIGRKLILFVDNDGARGSLIKGVSTSRPSARIVNWFWHTAAENELYVWVDRVPSKSNPADAPSRGSFVWLREQGYSIDEVPALEKFPASSKE